MTNRLYYQDPALLEFEARIVDSGKHGELFFTVLDNSAFYPTSGGQLHDTGLLGDVAVVDVIETDDGDVWHLSEKPIGKVGDAVKGVIEKQRRRRHRQQHTAQHILSQTFLKLCSFETVSVHLGEEYGAIEFNAEVLTSQQRNAVEKYADEIIFDNLPVEIMIVDEKAAADLPFRRAPKRTGELRVIKIGEFDWSACGGTHCQNTAEVGIVKLIGTEKIRGHLLVKFLAGVQVADDYAMRFTVTDELSQTLTCHVTDLVDKFDNLQSKNRDLKREIVALQKEMLPAKVEQLAADATETGSTRLVFQKLDDYDAKIVPQLASSVAESIDGVAVIFLDGRMVVATSAGSGVNAGQVVKQLVEQAGLKGGGSPLLAQAGGAQAEKLAQYREIIVKVLSNA